MNKYGNRKTVVDGVVFDSAREARRWQELKLLERAGEISHLRRQVPFELIPTQKEGKRVVERAVTYVADFVYTDNATGGSVVEDAKGIRTKEYILKRKMMRYLCGVIVREV